LRPSTRSSTADHSVPVSRRPAFHALAIAGLLVVPATSMHVGETGRPGPGGVNRIDARVRGMPFALESAYAHEIAMSSQIRTCPRPSTVQGWVRDHVTHIMSLAD